MESKRFNYLTMIFILAAVTLAAGTSFGVTDGGASDVKQVADAGVAPAPAPADVDIVKVLPDIYKAFKEAKWAWFVGLIFMALTWLFNRVLKGVIPKKALPWVAVGLGVGTNIAMSLASGLPWYEAIGQGITLGLAAAGGWSAVGRHLFPKQVDKG